MKNRIRGVKDLVQRENWFIFITDDTSNKNNKDEINKTNKKENNKNKNNINEFNKENNDIKNNNDYPREIKQEYAYFYRNKGNIYF